MKILLCSMSACDSRDPMGITQSRICSLGEICGSSVITCGCPICVSGTTLTFLSPCMANCVSGTDIWLISWVSGTLDTSPPCSHSALNSSSALSLGIAPFPLLSSGISQVQFLYLCISMYCCKDRNNNIIQYFSHPPSSEESAS